MGRLQLDTTRLTWLRRLVLGPESLALGAVILLVELLGPSSTDDLDDLAWVLFLPMLVMAGCSLARSRPMPLTTALVDVAVHFARRLRTRLVLSLGLDFHPRARPRPLPFTGLRRVATGLALAAMVMLAAPGFVRELLAATRVRGLYTLHVVGLGVVWGGLAIGILLQLAAGLGVVYEVVKRRWKLEGATRAVVVVAVVAALGTLLVALHDQTGVMGGLGVLAFSCLLPFVLRPVDPPRGPWLNLALGTDGGPLTTRIGSILGDMQRLLSIESVLVVAALVGTTRVDNALFPVTDTLLAAFTWLAVWLSTGGSWLAISEFNRRRRLDDPSFQRSKVLWALPGPEGDALRLERHAIERAGWRLIVADRIPGLDDADLFVGTAGEVAPPTRVPLTRVPSALFLLAPDPGAVLDEAEERDKADRSRELLMRLLGATRPRAQDHGEGTFIVPHCWLVVGLTRDDDRGGIERASGMSFGQSFQNVLGTRLRRFLFEVMYRASIDVVYVEDAVTPEQFGEVLDRLFARHFERARPRAVAEHDFVGIHGVRVVLHDVTPETEEIDGLQDQPSRQAISRARILIVGKDRPDDDDGGDDPSDDESNDLWLRESLTRLFPKLQPTG